MKKSIDIITFLKNLPAFRNFSEEEIAYVSENLECRQIDSGENIFEEFDKSDYFAILYQGEVELLKWDKERNQQYKIRTLHAGEIFGEMGFIDEETRSASAKAIKYSIVLIFNKTVFQNAELGNRKLYNLILTNMSKIAIPRLRKTNEDFVASLKIEVRELKLREQFGHFFICVIIVFGIGSVFDSFVTKHLADARSNFFNWFYLIVLAIPFLILIKIYNFSLKEAGVTLNNWKKSLFEGGVLSLLFFLVYYFAVKWFVTNSFQSSQLSYQFSPVFFLVYFPHAYIQEFFARGIFQTVLQRFYDDKKGAKSVFVTSLMFGIFHLHFGFSEAVITFLASLLFGFIYIRSYNLIGVTLVHYTLGRIAMTLGWI